MRGEERRGERRRKARKIGCEGSRRGRGEGRDKGGDTPL